jgi:hypothetical protein
MLGRIPSSEVMLVALPDHQAADAGVRPNRQHP